MKAREYRNICLIASDYWSGNHLLRPRSASYRRTLCELAKAYRATNPTNRQRELMEAYLRAGGE